MPEHIKEVGRKSHHAVALGKAKATKGHGWKQDSGDKIDEPACERVAADTKARYPA